MRERHGKERLVCWPKVGESSNMETRKEERGNQRVVKEHERRE